MRGTRASIAMASNLTKEIGDASAAGFHGVYTDRRGRENKCSNGEPSTENRVSTKEPICHGYG